MPNGDEGQKGEENEMRKLIKNAARCLKCGDVIESKHRHDMKFCKCGLIGVDGGLAYARRVFSTEDWQASYEDLSEYEGEAEF